MKLEVNAKNLAVFGVVFTITFTIVYVVFLSPKSTAILIKIDYSGQWSGAIGYDTTTKSIEGYGPETRKITFKGRGMKIISAAIQKMDSGYDKLTVSITTEDGRILKQASTTAEYGVVSISWSD